MSLNGINLPPYLVVQLYSKSLVCESMQNKNSSAGRPEAEPVIPHNDIPLKYLGNHQKKVLIVVNFPGVNIIPDPQLDFLISLLNACKLGLNDVAVLNINNYKEQPYTNILNELDSKIILLFGISTDGFGFPFRMPDYQVQNFNRQIVLQSAALQDIQNDKAAKTKLWAGLKKTFNI